MKTYAIIDRYSGFVLGVADAETPCEACRIVDETEVKDYGFAYLAVSRGEICDSGYDVHEAPAGWTCDDGQDEAQIAEVSAMPIAAYVMRGGR